MAKKVQKNIQRLKNQIKSTKQTISEEIQLNRIYKK
jgi:hypothetical protein